MAESSGRPVAGAVLTAAGVSFDGWSIFVAASLGRASVHCPYFVHAARPFATSGARPSTIRLQRALALRMGAAVVKAIGAEPAIVAASL